MQNTSGIVKSAGIIALAFIVMAIAWNLLVEYATVWVSSNPEQVASDLMAVAANRGQYLGFMSVDILYNLGIVALGGLFYSIFSSYSRPLAIFGGLGFVVSGAMWLMMDAPGLAQYQLALDYSAASGAAASAIAQRAADLSLMGGYSFAPTAILLGVGTLSFGAVIVRSGAISRLLGWLAVIAGILMLASLVNTFEGSLLSRIAYNVTEFWILATGLWLVFRGVKASQQQPAIGS